MLNKKNNFMINCSVVLLFLLLAILMVSPLVTTGRIAAQVDWLFHASRVEQIYRNLKEGSLFTYIATSTFQGTGVGSFLFYPVVFIYPWALLRFVLAPVQAYYVWVAGVLFLTMVISYFSMLSFSKNAHVRSLLFALLYTMAPYHLYLGPASFVIGEFVATAFIPLVFLGFYQVMWGRRSKWYLLSLGMTLLLYSHMLSVLLTSEILVGLLLWGSFKQKKLAWSRLLTLCASALVVLILGLPILIPLLTDYVGQGITATYPGVGMLQTLGEVVVASFSNLATSSSVGLVLLLVLLSGWKWIKKDSYELPLYVAALILTLLSTSVFPWKYFNGTFLTVLQLPYRYLIYVILFTAILAARGLETFFLRQKWYLTPKGKKATVCSLLIVLLLGYFGSISNLTDRLASTEKNKATVLKKLAPGEQKILYAGLLNNKNYQYQFDYWAQTGEVDYFPTKTLKKDHFLEYIVMDWEKAYRTNKDVYSIINNETYVDGKSSPLRPVTQANRFDYTLDLAKQTMLDLPIIHYKHTVVMLDGQKVSYQNSKRQTIALQVPKGKHQLTISYQPSRWFFLGGKVALLSWGLLLGWILWDLIRCKKTQQ